MLFRSHLDGHAVFQIVEGVAHVLGLHLVLVVVGVHEHIHGVGEVGIGALLVVQDDLVHLVVGLEDDFGTGAVEQVLHLHAHGGGTAAKNAYNYIGASVDVTRPVGQGAVVGAGLNYAYNTDGQAAVKSSATFLKFFANFKF